MLARTWKHQWLLLCPAKFRKIVGVMDPTKLKTKLACILEADESTRMRVGNSMPNYHENHIAGKCEKSLQHYNLVHKLIPMPQAMKIPAAKAAGTCDTTSGQERRRLRALRAVLTCAACACRGFRPCAC